MLYKSLALVSILGVVGLVLIVKAQSNQARDAGKVICVKLDQRSLDTFDHAKTLI